MRGGRAAMAKKGSPCVSVCQFDGRSGWCVGCGCTLEEIKGWKKLSPFRRTALEADVLRRVRQLGESQTTERHRGRSR